MLSRNQVTDLLLKSILPTFLLTLFLVTRKSTFWIFIGYSLQSLVWYSLLFLFFRYLFSRLLTDQFFSLIDFPEIPSRWILPGCIFTPLCLILGAFLSSRFGWVGGLGVALACNIVIALSSYRYGVKLRSSLDEIQDLSHPYCGPRGWTIVVSRRFNIPELEEKYQAEVLPVLKKAGIVMECYFADEEAQSIDFWVNRMLIIFEIADIHILIEHEPSPAIEIEQFLSDLIAYKGRKLGTSFTLGEEVQVTPVRPRPVLVKLKDHPCKSGFYPYTYGREVQLYWPLDRNHERFSRELDSCLNEIKKRLIWMVKVSPWSQAYGTEEVFSIFQKRNRLAEIFSRKAKAKDFEQLLKGIQEDEKMVLNHAMVTAQNELFNTYLKEKYQKANKTEVNFTEKEIAATETVQASFKSMIQEGEDVPWYGKLLLQFGKAVTQLRIMWLSLKEKFYDRSKKNGPTPL